MSKRDSSDDSAAELEQPFLSHLVELRDRLLRAILGVLVAFAVLVPFANKLYILVARPLMAHLPAGSSMIAIDVASPFLAPFKLTMALAIFLAMPWILYQIWSFVAPGLYRHERRLIVPLLVTSSILFYLGMIFAYFVVFPLVFAFMSRTAPAGVQMATDINRYLSFVLTIFFAFGVAFEVPIATILMVWAGITTRASLAAKRPYIIVVVFFVGAALTPPDVISQTLLALPMWGLFELGVWFSRFYERKKDDEEEEGGDSGSGEASDAGVAPARDAGAAAVAADFDTTGQTATGDGTGDATQGQERTDGAAGTDEEPPDAPPAKD